MKLLLDSCISRSAYQELSCAGFDVIWSGAWPKDPGDEVILKVALDESRILITGDRDFGELIVVNNIRQIGMIRLVDIRSINEASVVIQLLRTYAAELAAGVIITAERWRIRVRKL